MDAGPLKQLFTLQNLGEVTACLIEAFKSKDEGRIRRILQAAGRAASGDLSRDFTDSIKLFHPDRLQYYLNLMENEALIRELPRLDSVLREVRSGGAAVSVSRASPGRDEDVSFEEERGYGSEDFDAWRETEWAETDELDQDEFSEEEPRSFVEALKLKEYGSLDVSYTPGVLRSLEGSLDVSDFEIDDLRGAEFCENVTALNLSNNLISDLGPLSSLGKLEELFISENQIDSLEPLKGLTALRVLDVSYNMIEDISALLGLTNLEFVNLVGNEIPQAQKTALSARGVLVVG